MDLSIGLALAMDFGLNFAEKDCTWQCCGVCVALSSRFPITAARGLFLDIIVVLVNAIPFILKTQPLIGHCRYVHITTRTENYSHIFLLKEKANYLIFQMFWRFLDKNS